MGNFSSSFYAIFIKDYRILNQLTLDNVSEALSNFGVSYKKGVLSRMENGQLNISDTFFQNFCQAYKIQFHICQDPQRTEVVQLYRLLSDHLEHKRIDQSEIVQKIQNLAADDLLSSDLRLPFRILSSVLVTPDLYDKSFEAVMKDLLRLGALNLKAETPPVDPDYFSLVAYYYGLYLLRQNNPDKARKYFDLCSSSSTGKIIPLLSVCGDYQKIRCQETWKHPKEAIQLCQKTISVFNQHQCFRRVWNLELLKATYLVRNGQVDPARELILNLQKEAYWLISGNWEEMILQNLIWLEAVAGNDAECLHYVEQYKQAKFDSPSWDMDFYQAYCNYRLGRVKEAKDILEQNIHREEYDFEDRMMVLLKLRMMNSKVFPKKAKSFLHLFHEGNIPEAVAWTLDLLRDFYADIKDTEKLLLVSDAALQYARTRALSKNPFEDIQP